jgi:hypothetical protein
VDNIRYKSKYPNLGNKDEVENKKWNDATDRNCKSVIDLIKQRSLEFRKMEAETKGEVEKQVDNWFLRVDNWFLQASSRFSQMWLSREKMCALGLGLMFGLAKLSGALNQTHMSDSSALDFPWRGNDNSTDLTPASTLDLTNRTSLPLSEFDYRKVTPELMEHFRKVGVPDPEGLIRDVSQGRYDRETAQSMTENSSSLQNQGLRLRRKMKLARLLKARSNIASRKMIAGEETPQSAMETSSRQLKQGESKKSESLELSKKVLVNEHEIAQTGFQGVASDKQLLQSLPSLSQKPEIYKFLDFLVKNQNVMDRVSIRYQVQKFMKCINDPSQELEIVKCINNLLQTPEIAKCVKNFLHIEKRLSITHKSALIQANHENSQLHVRKLLQYFDNWEAEKCYYRCEDFFDRYDHWWLRNRDRLECRAKCNENYNYAIYYDFLTIYGRIGRMIVTIGVVIGGLALLLCCRQGSHDARRNNQQDPAEVYRQQHQEASYRPNHEFIQQDPVEVYRQQHQEASYWPNHEFIQQDPVEVYRQQHQEAYYRTNDEFIRRYQAHLEWQKRYHDARRRQRDTAT